MTDKPSEMEFQLDLVRRNAASGRNFTEWRDVAICRAYAAGATFRQIAEVAKMSYEGVRQVVTKQNAKLGLDNSVDRSTIGL